MVSLLTVRRRKPAHRMPHVRLATLHGGREPRELQGRWFLTSFFREACFECYLRCMYFAGDVDDSFKRYSVI